MPGWMVHQLTETPQKPASGNTSRPRVGSEWCAQDGLDWRPQAGILAGRRRAV